MLKRVFILIVVLVAMLLAGTFPALAQFGPENVYVDTSYDGNENGSKTKPYNTIKEGRAYAQTRPNGARLFISSDGTWSYIPSEIYSPVYSGAGGAPIPTSTLYLILAFVALVLILLGWQFQQRSRDLRG